MDKIQEALTWRVKHLKDMTPYELHDSLKLRADVFVLEQTCLFPDIDGKDDQALHVLGYENDQLVAYTRIFDKGLYFPMASLGRVVVAQNKRGKNYGHELLNVTLRSLYDAYGKQPIHISAQCEFTGFYESHGFIATGEEYLEDGIPHIGMEKEAPSTF